MSSVAGRRRMTPWENNDMIKSKRFLKRRAKATDEILYRVIIAAWILEIFGVITVIIALLLRAHF